MTTDLWFVLWCLSVAFTAVVFATIIVRRIRGMR